MTALIAPQPVIARLVPGNPVIKPFGVAELLIPAASPQTSHATRKKSPKFHKNRVYYAEEPVARLSIGWRMRRPS
ncbi:hypothetical protein [Candidatus Spongiihabitans sp.]|uniref:hypothetical protein n=1 Tax=Candidatus Spongiihabitans sp. TaxID=3101308 RepID=UPI003C7C63F8